MDTQQPHDQTEATPVETVAPEDETPRFTVGDLVEVAPRTHPGLNFPGGTATIREIHDERSIDSETMRDGSARRTTSFTYDVKYVLGGSEKRVDAQWLSAFVDRGKRSSGGSKNTSTEAVAPVAVDANAAPPIQNMRPQSGDWRVIGAQV